MPVRLLCLSLLALLLAGCAPRQSVSQIADPLLLPTHEEFQDYWYNHGAEISRYRLQQARYGELHDGDAVLIFVTETFDPESQVKYEGSSPEQDGAVPVLKLNASRTFVTGIYPYSMMTSVFTPLDDREPLKVTTSSQEWCGHTFTQFNRQDDGWRLRLFSYFQEEGDQDRTLRDVPHESGIWTRIRLAPETLPTGQLSMIPSPIYQRLSHTRIQAYNVNANLTQIETHGPHGEALQAYTLTYPELDRTLTIRFQKEFPHVIEGWEETRNSFGEQLTTKAVRTHSRMQPYWQLNQPGDRQLRRELGLSPH